MIVQVGRTFINTANVNYVDKASDGMVHVHFTGDVRSFAGKEAVAVWKWYQKHCEHHLLQELREKTE